MLQRTLTATLSNNTSVMVAVKYTVDGLKLYAGCEWMQFAPPIDAFSVPFTGFINNSGDFCLALNAIPPPAAPTSTARPSAPLVFAQNFASRLGRREIIPHRGRAARRMG
jgi:hypothetical protein